MSKPTVLVVEDERPIATLLAKIVEECGAVAKIVGNGAEALRWMKHDRPDLVLLDLIMPVMSGEEVLREMDEDARLAEVPVVVVSTKERLAEEPRREVDFLRKPFMPADVKQLVREKLGLA